MIRIGDGDCDHGDWSWCVSHSKINSVNEWCRAHDRFSWIRSMNSRGELVQVAEFGVRHLIIPCLPNSLGIVRRNQISIRTLASSSEQSSHQSSSLTIEMVSCNGIGVGIHKLHLSLICHMTPTQWTMRVDTTGRQSVACSWCLPTNFELNRSKFLRESTAASKWRSGIDVDDHHTRRYVLHFHARTVSVPSPQLCWLVFSTRTISDGANVMASGATKASRVLYSLVFRAYSIVWSLATHSKLCDDDDQCQIVIVFVRLNDSRCLCREAPSNNWKLSEWTKKRQKKSQTNNNIERIDF